MPTLKIVEFQRLLVGPVHHAPGRPRWRAVPPTRPVVVERSENRVGQEVFQTPAQVDLVVLDGFAHARLVG